MKKLSRLLPILGAVLFLILPGRGTYAEEVKAEIKWDEFLSRHDLVWKTLPEVWHEGAFTGNGLLGAMIYAEGKKTLRWDVGRSDVADRGSRIGIGHFILRPSATNFHGMMRIDLWNAEAHGELSGEGGNLKWRSFTHAKELVNVIELTEHPDSPPAKIEFRHHPAIPAREDFHKAIIPEDEANPAPVFGESRGVQWCVQAFKVGGGYVVAWRERQLSPGRRIFYFTVDYTSTGTLSKTKAVANIQNAAKADFEKLVHSHRVWWHTYYPQSFVSIPDTRMESFYWIQMYKLASGTRADRPALDLMGPWFRHTPWPKIWWNLNIQLTYWPVYTANRLELGESLTRMIDSGKPNLINNAPAQWRHDSAMVQRTSDHNCVSVDHRMNGKGPEFGNLTWALHNYWLQYRYSGDEKLLRKDLYPLLKRSVAFYLHLLEQGNDGKLHLPMAVSPEYPDLASDTNYDLSLLRWGLMTLLATNERFGLKDPMAETWRKTLDNLAPFPVDAKSGYMIGAGVPLTKSHRHFSHLLMLYPLHLVDPQCKDDRPLIEKSVDHWMSLKVSLKGYSFTGASAMSAWLGHKDNAVRLLNEFLDSHVKANTMYLEAGPVIETPLSAAASIHEMLLQSWCMEPFGTHIRVFPAIPDEWKEASFHKLLAEGAFEVSAVRQGGRTKFVQITSRAGAVCRVSTGLKEPIAASGRRTFNLTQGTDSNGQQVTTIDLRKGETVTLYSVGEELKGNWSIQALPAEPDRMNYYGLSKNHPEEKHKKHSHASR